VTGFNNGLIGSIFLTGGTGEAGSSEGFGGPHFLPRRPIERARTSAVLYSTPSLVNKRDRSKRSFSGRRPGTGGASIGAYREWPYFTAEDGVTVDALDVEDSVVEDAELVFDVWPLDGGGRAEAGKCLNGFFRKASTSEEPLGANDRRDFGVGREGGDCRA